MAPPTVVIKKAIAKVADPGKRLLSAKLIMRRGRIKKLFILMMSLLFRVYMYAVSV